MKVSPVLLLYVIVQFIAFLFVLVGTPMDMLHDRRGGRFGNTPCVTLWGYKLQCYNSSYEARVDVLWMSCRGRRNAFRGAQAFAVISIFVYGLAAAFGFIALWCCCSRLRWVCLALNITGIATLCVVWATIVVTYYKADDLCVRENDVSFFGSGFVLLLVAWCLDIINIVLLLLPFQAMHASDSAYIKE